MASMTSLNPIRVAKPGQILDRELKARDWTQKDLADIMGRPVQAINEIIGGIKQITPKTAHELGQAFGTSAEFWMNLETNYRLHLAAHGEDDSIARKSRLYSIAPVKELLKRVWIRGSGSLADLEEAVCAFLGISEPTEQPTLAANRRHSTAREAASVSQIATIKRGEHLARAQRLTGAFKKERLVRELPTLMALTRDVASVREIPDWFAARGVHFVIVPQLPQSFLDGAFFTVDGAPVILLTLRYDRIDSFWFTLMHEVGHLIAGHDGVFIDNIDEEKNDRAEKEANAFAIEQLIEPGLFEAFAASAKPFFSRAAIAAFGRKVERHPGIILGRLHHKEFVHYRNLRMLLERVSPELGPWIDRPSPGKTVITA